jgi:hypothetical protein
MNSVQNQLSQRQFNALKKSIRHWEDIVAILKRNPSSSINFSNGFLIGDTDVFSIGCGGLCSLSSLH